MVLQDCARGKSYIFEIFVGQQLELASTSTVVPFGPFYVCSNVSCHG